MKSKLTIKIYKGGEAIISVSDEMGFKQDMALTKEELEQLRKVLKNK